MRWKIGSLRPTTPPGALVTVEILDIVGDEGRDGSTSIPEVESHILCARKPLVF